MTHPPEQQGTPATTATGPQTTQDRARPAGPAHTNPMPTRPAQVAPLRESRQVASAVTPASAPRPVADVVRLAVPPERPTATEAAADVAASPGAGLAMKPEAMPVAAAGAPRSAVVPKDRIELFSAERLGVDRIEAGAVVMRSGRRVRVGETFDSGEVLREADPTRGRIVTDQRNIALL